MSSVHRFFTHHSLLILPAMAFAAAAGMLSAYSISPLVWAALVIALLAVWAIPLWLPHKATALASADDLYQRLRSGTVSLVEVYSDF